MEFLEDYEWSMPLIEKLEKVLSKKKTCIGDFNILIF
jgi:hypothetical protein